MAALYERYAREANDNRVQDLTNRFLDGRREILRTGPDAYYNLQGAEAIHGADAATEKLTALRDRLFGQTANDYQRRKLDSILDTHLAASAAGIARHTAEQQDVHIRGVAAAAIETSRAEALADPATMANAVLRAEDAARVLHAGQPADVIERGVRAAGGSVIAGVIGDRLARNDPQGVALFHRYADRLDPGTRRTLGATAEMLSNTLDAAAWLRERSATLRPPAPTGDAALDAVNAGGSPAEPPPVISSGGALLDPDGGIAGTRQRLAEIEERQRALTALNRQEFAANPIRLRANQDAIDIDTVRRDAAVKAETDGLYADLRRHLTTSGPDGGPALTLPPSAILSRLTDAQRESVTAQVKANIAGRKTASDPQTRYTIRRGLTVDDAGERQRWAATSLVPFMGRLSPGDYAALETLQSAVRNDDDGADQDRLRSVTRMADQVLRAAGIDPTPRPDAAPGSDAARAAQFHRSLQTDLAAFESKGRPPTEAEAYAIVNGLKDTAIKSGWLKVSNSGVDGPPADDTLREGSLPSERGHRSWVTLDVDRVRRMREEDESAIGGSTGAPATEPDSSSPEYQAADAQAHQMVARQTGNVSGAGHIEAAPRSVSRDASVAVPGAPALAPAGQAALEAAKRAASLLARAAPVAAGAAVAAPILLIPGNSGAEFHPIGEDLRVRTAPGQLSATVQRRVDDGFFGTGIGAKWIDLPVRAELAIDEHTSRGYIAIDRRGLEQAIGRDAADAAFGSGGIAMAPPPRNKGEEDEWGEEPQENTKHRDRRQNRPPQAEDLEQRPDRAPSKPPHELSDEEVADIAHKIASGHASKKHREEFPEFGSDTEFEYHVANVIKDKRSENKTTPKGHTAYWHRDSGTAIVVDPLAPDKGTVLRPENGRKFFDNIPTKYY